MSAQVSSAMTLNGQAAITVCIDDDYYKLAHHVLLAVSLAAVCTSSQGMYAVVYANCDPVNGMLTLEGQTEWMNPYGEQSES